ncbi:MAG: phospholipid scramblase-related protein [Myxococcales bacterium]
MPRCPACSELLFRRRIEGVEADGCPGCGGLWMDAGELQALAKTPAALRKLDKIFTPGVQAGEPEPNGRCPRCEQPLGQMEFEQFRGIRLDRCKACGGIWLDHGEATGIADRLDPPSEPAPVAVAPTVIDFATGGPPVAFRGDVAASWVPAPTVASTVPVHESRGHSEWGGHFWDEVHASDHLTVKQRFEIAELFGFETRNKYEIWSENRAIGWAAEQGKSVLEFITRRFLGHWRSFEILIFDESRQPVLQAYHPFRVFFQRLEVSLANGTYLGAIQQRFSLLSKRFDVQGPDGRVLMTVDSPIWRLWTFPFRRGAEEVGVVLKRWGGLLTEGFTDRDSFTVKLGRTLSDSERALLLAAAIFIDLQYFERKAQ